MSSRARIVLGLCLALLLTAATRLNAAPDAPADLKARVARLVEQLGMADKQVAAQTELIKLGPEILPLLPSDDAKLSPKQKERLKEIRATLTEAQVLKDLAPKLVTLQNKSIRLTEALDQIKKQTGEEVVDRREGGDNPTLKLDLQKATFWQAVDTVAKEADLRVSLREEDGKVTLREGPFRALPTSYNGMFRVTVLRLSTTRDLDRDVHECTVDMEIAWEPRFHPLFRQSQAENLVVQDDKGVALKSVVRDGGGRLPIRNKLTADVQVLLEAPRRGVNHLGLLKGSFSIVGPSKMLGVTFDTLTKVDRSTPVEKVPFKTIDGVTVRIRELTTENDLWTLGMLLEYPHNALEFESFESWLVHNEAFIENKAGKRFPPTGGYEIVEQEGNKAMINYRFVEEKGLVLGKPENWKLIYRTPGTISKVPIKFEFKDVPLP
jgi:hypothetical protein